jgi:hypothetical protein
MFFEFYQRNTEEISIYYDHSLAIQNFNSKFYFDGSTNISKKDITTNDTHLTGDYYVIPSLKSLSYISGILGTYPKDKKIKIAQGSQGLVISNLKYKILWKYINHDHFYYIEGIDILPIYQQYCVTSDNKNEILYLFSIFNSKLISLILNTLCKIEQEDKLSILLGLTSIKEFIRVPKISNSNKGLKEIIIQLTENLLNLEKIFLSSLIDFSKVFIQKFDKAHVKDNKLVLIKADQKIELPIKQNVSLVTKVINENYSQTGLALENKHITLSELTNLPVIDFDKQKVIKDLIDDLVYCLYFNIDVPKNKISNATFVKSQCQKNKFYKLISE